jgi:hypothetical protein
MMRDLKSKEWKNRAWVNSEVKNPDLLLILALGFDASFLVSLYDLHDKLNIPVNGYPLHYTICSAPM